MPKPLAQTPESSSPKMATEDIVREQDDLMTYFFPQTQAVSSLSDFLIKATMPPGRYRSPRRMIEDLMLEYHTRLAELGGITVPGSFVFPNPLYSIPPQWQAIFDYLHGEGLITSRYVVFEKLFHDEPKFFSLRIFSVFGTEPTDGLVPSTTGHSRGVSLDFEEAISKVIGEFLERYPLTLYTRRNLVRASMKNLAQSKERFLDINDLAGFANWQKELLTYKQFDDSSNFFWAEGKELISGQRALIPAQLVFWNYNTLQEPREPYLRQPNTNGAAGHFTRTEAILAGIYENIQRDAFLIHWLNNIAPPRIMLDTIEDAVLQDALKQIKRYGFEVILLNTTLDCEVPSCACVLIDTSGRGPKISVGGGCGPSIEQAVMRGLTEAHGVYHWLRTQPESSVTLSNEYTPFRDPAIRHDSRLLLWGDEAMFPRFTPFISGREQSLHDAGSVSHSTSFATPEEELRSVLDTFRKKGKGYEVYVYEAQHRILKTLGYSSVRVIIPALIPLYLSEQDACLGSSRLRTVPRDMNLNASKDFNPWPHPFP